MSSIYELYESTIKPAVFEQLDTVFPEFGWQRLGRGWVATNSIHTKGAVGTRADRVVCNPTGGQIPGGFMVHGTDTPVLWTEYLNNGLKPTGREFVDIVTDLGRRVGVSVEMSESYRKEVEERRVRREAELERAKSAHERRSGVEKYWASRTLPGDSIPEDIGAIEGHLYALIRDHRGEVAGSFVRRLDGGEPKYKYSEGLNWDDLIATNLSVAVKSKEMTAVEGVLDPFVLSPHGVEVQAVGGSLDKLTVERWKRIIKLGIKTVWLMGDNDEPGQKGVRKALDAFRSMDQDDLVDIRVVDTVDYEACKDPGEMLQALGASSIHTARAKAQHHYWWLAQDMVARHRAGGWTSASLAQCVSESIDFLRTVPAKQWPFACINYTGYLEANVPDYARVRLEIEQRVEREREEQSRIRNAESIVKQATGLLGNLGDATAHEFKVLANRLTEFATEPVNRPTSEQLLDIHEARVEKYRGLEERIIGLAQRTLPLVDELTCGLRGVTLVVAPPNVGKTALTWQWGLDIVKDNPKAGFVCFSMEMSAEAMLTRAICNMAGVGWRDYMFGTLTPQQEIRVKAARARWRAISSRVLILDRECVVECDAGSVRRIVDSWADEAQVERVYQLIDYIQAWPIPDAVQHAAARGQGGTVESWLMELCLALVRNGGDDPVVAISTQRKAPGDSGQSGGWANGLDAAMGAAIVTYAPDVVGFLQPIRDDELRHLLNDKYNQMIEPLGPKDLEKEMAKWRERMRQDGRAMLKLVIAKGRDGTERGAVPMTFYFRENKFKQEWEWDVFTGHKDERAVSDELPPGFEGGREVSGRPDNVATVYSMGSGEVLDDGEPV